MKKFDDGNIQIQYSDENEPCVLELMNQVLIAYETITSLFKLKNYDRKIIIQLYNSVEELHKEVFGEKREEWEVALEGEDGNLKLVNLLRRTDIPNGVNMLGQLGDFVFPDIFNDETLIAEGPYEYGEVRLKEGDVVFDCGSNFGVFSVYAASKGCQSYAFEPTPALNDLIKQQSALNGEKIHPVLMAVSDAEGEAVFHVDEYSSGGSSLLKRAESTSDIKVKLTSLDQFVETHHLDKVDFIKADIEGAERLLLKGAKNILKQHQPALALCTYHLPDDKEVLSRLILEANPNYKIVYRWQKLFAYVPKKVT